MPFHCTYKSYWYSLITVMLMGKQVFFLTGGVRRCFPMAQLISCRPERRGQRVPPRFGSHGEPKFRSFTWAHHKVMDLGHRFATMTFGVCSFQVILLMSLAAVRVFWRMRDDWQLQPASKSHGGESDTTTWWNAESLCMFFFEPHMEDMMRIGSRYSRYGRSGGGVSLQWRSAPWSRLTTYFDNPQSREAGSIDGIDGIDGTDMNLKWIDIYWNMNWHDMKSRKAASQVFCANAGDSRCVLARHCAQWVGWRMLEAAHRQQMGFIVGCVCIRSWERHMSPTLSER